MTAMATPADGARRLYLSIDEAAAWAGIGRDTMRDYVNSADPPPYLDVGRGDRSIKRIQAAALPAYLERKQQVREGR